MKLRGSEEQVILSTKIRNCNLEIIQKMKSAILNKEIWPDVSGDKAGNEVRDRYRQESLEALTLLSEEFNNIEADFYKSGDSTPILSLPTARHSAVQEDSKNLGKEGYQSQVHKIEIYEDRLSTVFSHMVSGKSWSYVSMVPEYSFVIK